MSPPSLKSHVGLQIDLELENLPGHMSHLLEEGQRGGGDVVKVERLQRSNDCSTMRFWSLGSLASLLVKDQMLSF